MSFPKRIAPSAATFSDRIFDHVRNGHSEVNHLSTADRSELTALFLRENTDYLYDIDFSNALGIWASSPETADWAVELAVAMRAEVREAIDVALDEEYTNQHGEPSTLVAEMADYR